MGVKLAFWKKGRNEVDPELELDPAETSRSRGGGGGERRKKQKVYSKQKR